MTRTDPDKLAQALRANLRRRKAAGSAKAPPPAPNSPEMPPEQPAANPVDGQG
jgi:hypothetical protein